MATENIVYDFPNNTFRTWDYVVFGGVLVISAAIGIYYGCTGGKQKTTSEFLMADRQMSVFPVSVSLLASFMSAITLLGTPSEIYTFGTQYWMVCFGYILMIPLTVHIYVPIFYNLRLTSVYEYLELRFGWQVRVFACCCFILQMILYMAIVLYTPCLALEVVTGFNKWISVCLVGIVCTFYTTIGGIKAVMWTDTFQMFMMFAGLIAVLVRGSMDFGGFPQMWQFLVETDRVEWFVWDPNPLIRHSTWSLVFGGCFTWLAVYGTNQAQVQRALCCPKLISGQIALYINMPGLCILLIICAMCGIVVFAEYRTCDPLLTNRIEAKDQLLPQYVMDRLFYPGLPGLFTACLFSGALSTISSGLNSLAAVTLQDLVLGRCVKGMSESKAAVLSKIIAFSYGVVMIGLSFLASQLGGVLQAALGLFGMIGGPVLGVFTLGIIYPWANHIGAFVGTLTGLILTLWVGIGAQVYKPAIPRPPIDISGCPILEFNGTMTTTMPTSLMMTSAATEPPMDDDGPAGFLSIYRMSYLWYSAFAVLVTTVVGLLVSAMTGFNKPEDIDPRLIHPIIYRLFCCAPEKQRRKFKCRVGENVDEEDTQDIHYTTEKKPGETNGYVNPALSVESETYSTRL